MKNYFNKLNKAFENRSRLGIMSALVINDYVDFNTLKDLLDLTDGNLAGHTRSLEKLGYITYEKHFVGRKPNTRFYATEEGKKAFENHLNILEKIIKEV